MSGASECSCEQEGRRGELGLSFRENDRPVATGGGTRWIRPFAGEGNRVTMLVPGDRG